MSDGRTLFRALVLCGAGVALAGCHSFYEVAGIFTGVNVVSLAAIHRTIPDAVYSVLRNRDCSAVRLEQGQSYCVPIDPGPGPQEACTETIGSVDCWARPTQMPGDPTYLADTPTETPAQIAARAHRWPDL